MSPNHAHGAAIKFLISRLFIIKGLAGCVFYEVKKASLDGPPVLFTATLIRFFWHFMQIVFTHVPVYCISRQSLPTFTDIG